VESAQKTINCLKCGVCLDGKENMINYCVDCFMGGDLRLEPIDREHIAGDIELIMKYFVSDVSSAFEKDPAAKSLVEVLTSYPGIQAVLIHRVAHFFWGVGLPFVPRYLSYIARQLTGIDIHPGAKIGGNFFIDHGQGVVIGETAEIGDNVTIYQGVTLGGTSLENKKRHPTLKNNIIVGAGAKILGPVIIGNNVRVGANSVVTKDIPDNSVVVGVPGRIISQTSDNMSKEIHELAHGNLPDPVLRLIERLESRIASLEQKFEGPTDQKK
jgi:serine O-acetyltransferase